MNKLTLQLLARKQLIEDCTKTDEYDGFSAEHMLESFINDNNYNPIVELKKLNKKLARKIIPELGVKKLVKKLRTMKFYEDMDKIRELDEILRKINIDFKERGLIHEFVLNYSQNMENR